MATKDYCYFSKDNPSLFIEKSSNEKYNDLNLNLNPKFFALSPIIPKSITKNGSKKFSNFDFSCDNKSKTLSLLSSNKNLQSNHKNGSYDFEKQELKEENDSKNAKSSTLSLLISAYENSVYSIFDPFFDGKDEKKSADNFIKQSMQSLQHPIFQNLFEFPRQQNEEVNEDSEISQFKALQKLFNPNESFLQKNEEEEQRMMKFVSLLDSTLLPITDCKQCQKIENQIEILEERIEELNEMLEHQKCLCKNLKEDIVDETADLELKNEYCHKLRNELESYLSTAGEFEKLPTFAQARIFELSNSVSKLKTERLNLNNEYLKQFNGYESETNLFNSLYNQYNAIKAKAQENQNEYERIKEQFLSRLIYFNNEIKEKSDKISSLKNTLSSSAKLFNKILDASNSFGNDEMKQEIQQFLESQLKKY
uniref:Uncharacterized protein n=1 Tax=Panagrolaimus sp. PS1159 TaxID=55785 RepID=A0AC35FKU2_9BILA